MFVIRNCKGLLILFSLNVATNIVASAKNNSIQHRDEKLISVVSSASMFTVAKFANTECERDFHKGTCYTSWDCHKGVNGPIDLFATSSSSRCQEGFGLCCITKLGCGATSSNNNTYLRSPGYNTKFNYGLDCTQTIKIDSSICQLRLGIIQLELAYPTSGGICDDDYLKVSQDYKFEYVCGVTQDMHFYLDVDANDNEHVAFQFHTSSSVSFERIWNIRVQKIMCNTDAEVMRGCGQYYTGTSGRIKGFNMDGSRLYNYLIHGQNYGVCVRMELGYCKTTYTELFRSNGWVPVCPDIFQRPAVLSTSTTPLSPQTIKCNPTGMSYSMVNEYSSYFLAPHIFWLDSTDASNTHLSKLANTNTDNHGTYDILYTQTKSGCA